MLDAYSIRKAVPRIVLAVIGINLSIYICIAAIDITMIIGRGIDSLFVASFKNANGFAVVSPESSTENGILAALLVPGAIWASIGLVAFLLTSLPLVGLLALAILLTLVIRQGLLIFLTVVSPVAIACFILPNTEKYFQKWADLFIRTLMVYPIVMIILAMSKVMASILIGTSSISENDSMGTAKVIAAILVIYAPLVLIPFAFKLAGGAIAQVSNMAEGRARQKGGSMKENALKNPDSLASKFNRGVQNKKSDAGLTGGQMWARTGGGLTKGNYSSRREARNARMGAAREFDQFKDRQALSETGRFRMNSQDSDALDAAVMNGDQAKIDKDILQQRAALTQKNTEIRAAGGKPTETSFNATDAFGNVQTFGEISDNEYARKMQGHARADAMGRTTASRLAAFNSADRIKFTENSYETERDLASNIVGGNPALLGGVMNEHQAVAKGPAGRSDLAASLYGDSAKVGKAASHTSESELMSQQRPQAVEGIINDQMSLLASADATYEQKQSAVRKLAGLKAQAKSNPYARTANKDAVLKHSGAIDDAVQAHITQTAGNSNPDVVAKVAKDEYYSAKEGAPTGATVTVRRDGKDYTTPMRQETVTGGNAAWARFQEESGRQLSQAEIAAAAAAAGTPTPPPKEGE